MFQHQQIWLPDGERHFPEWMSKHGELIDGKGTYQIRKLREALRHVREFRVAIDVGAHVGLWTMQLTNRFGTVHAFEPVEQFAACLVRNLADAKNVIGYPHALGAAPGRVRMAIDPADSGGTHVDRTAELGNVEMRTLDSFEFQDVDFLKVDCEGFEHHVLQGAVETLKRCRPCLIVEQKPHKLGPNFGIKGTPAVDLLKGLGAKERAVLSGDHILSWD